MKKNILISSLLFLILTVSVIRLILDTKQNHREKYGMELFAEMEIEQMAAIQTKQLTLHLGLTESQIKSFSKISLEIAKQRKENISALKNSKGKPSSQNIYKMINFKLDNQIKMKREASYFLNENQMKKLDELLLKQTKRNPFFKN